MNAQTAESAPLTIAVVKPCCIGDCVMTLPAIDALARAFPYAHIHAFAGRHSAPVFHASEHVSRVYLSPDALTASRTAGMAWNLRTAGHDWIVVLDRSRWLITAARMAAPHKLVTLPPAKRQLRHEIDVYLDALRAVGIRTPNTSPRVVPTDEARQAAATVVEDIGQRFVVLQPGGAENPGTSMFDKRWPADRFRELALQLARRGLRPVLTGGPADQSLCDGIADTIRELDPIVTAGRLDLISTASLIERGRLYVGPDTGVSHLAAAVGTPSVVIFGPTNPLRYGPRGDRVAILSPDASRDLHDVDLRKPGATSGRPSTAEVSVDDVLAACDGLLADAASKSP